MNKNALPSRQALKQTVFYTVLFSLLAHGYRFLTMAFSGDASQISQAEEITYQISIGRFLQPVLWHIRGMITAPLTIGLFSTAALTGAAILIVALLQLEDRRSILLTCGILATNETLGVSYATYLPWMDVYMFSLLFSVAAVYVSVRFRHGWLLSPLLYCCSLALYQSYLQVGAALIIILLMLRLLDGDNPAFIWADGIRACLSLLMGLLLYAAAFKILLGVMDIQPYRDYNGLTEVGVMSLSDIPGLLADTYLYPIRFFLRSAENAFVHPALTLVLLLLTLPVLAMLCRRLTVFSAVTFLFLLLILPLGANFVAFISKGIVHPLMVYAFYFLYILCIALWQRAGLALSAAKARVRRVFRFAGCLCAAIALLMIGGNIKTANQLYVKRDLEFYATTSAATRILKHIDAVEGYIPGETPVCFLGYLPSSRIDMERPGFETLANLQGMRYTYAASYETSTPWYYQMILGYPVNFVSTDDQFMYRHSDIAEKLPAYPEEGFCQMIDGILFVRIN